MQRAENLLVKSQLQGSRDVRSVQALEVNSEKLDVVTVVDNNVASEEDDDLMKPRVGVEQGHKRRGIGRLVHKRLMNRERNKLKNISRYNFTAEELPSVIKHMKDPYTGVRTRPISSEEGVLVFHGKALTTWLQSEGYVNNKRDAAIIGQRLLDVGCFTSVRTTTEQSGTTTNQFDDGRKTLYKFVDVYEEGTIHKGTEEEGWKQRLFAQGDLELLLKFISPNSVVEAQDILKLDPTTMYNFLPLIFEVCRQAMRTRSQTNRPYNDIVKLNSVSFLRSFRLRATKARMISLMRNPEFKRFSNFSLLFYEKAGYFDDNDHQEMIDWIINSTEVAADEEVHSEPDERTWAEMQPTEIVYENLKSARSGYSAKNINEQHNSFQIEGALLVDTIDVQTKTVLLDKLNTINDWAEGQVITEAAIQHPLVPNYDCHIPTRVTVEKVFSSLARPVLISFKQARNGSMIEEEDWEEVKPRVIYKQGDNLMQDYAVILAFKLFNVIWFTDDAFKKDVKATPFAFTYEVFPTGFNQTKIRAGFLEAVDNAEPLKDFDWASWIFSSNEDIISKMITSAAGAYISGYVLGVRDRHWDNIMIQNKETLLHIDFGFVLGTHPPIDAPNFSISSEMKAALMQIHKWEEFIELCIKAFLVLRRRSAEVINACKMLFGFMLEMEHKSVEAFIMGSLMLDLKEEEVVVKLRSEIEESSVLWQNFLKQFSHKTIDPMWYGLLKKHFPPAVAIMSQVEASTRRRQDSGKAKADELVPLRLGERRSSVKPGDV